MTKVASHVLFFKISLQINGKIKNLIRNWSTMWHYCGNFLLKGKLSTLFHTSVRNHCLHACMIFHVCPLVRQMNTILMGLKYSELSIHFPDCAVRFQWSCSWILEVIGEAQIRLTEQSETLLHRKVQGEIYWLFQLCFVSWDLIWLINLLSTLIFFLG